MWVESVEPVGDEPVRLAVECLDDAARERTAATIAWLTLEAVGQGTFETPALWHGFMDDVLRHHVAFAVAEERMVNLGPDWWQKAVGLALSQFMRQNGLAPSVHRHIEALQRIGRPGVKES